MLYWIILVDQHGDAYHHYDNFLPGLIPPHVLEMMRVPFGVDALGICEHCTFDHRCHVIEAGTGRKYCPVLFHDAIKPSWSLAELVG